MPSVEITSNAMFLNVPIGLSGNIGVGTTNPLYPLQVVGPFVDYGASYASIPYVDYTNLDAYTNRTNLTIIGDNDEGYALLPDFGFDFLLNGQNYRSNAYPVTNSYINFGSCNVLYSPDPSDFSMPTLLVGAGDNIVYSISYYIGTYEQDGAAMYVFFDAEDFENSANKNKWCVVFTEMNKIYIFLKEIEGEYPMDYGLWKGDNWAVILPEDETNTPRYDTAYVISTFPIYGNTMSIHGRSFLLGNVGIGTETAQYALDVNGTARASQFVGDGSQLTSAAGWVVNNSTSMYTTKSVGIGTNIPFAKLHIPYGNGFLKKNTLLIGNNEEVFEDSIFALQFANQPNKDAGMGVYSSIRGVFGKQGLGVHVTDTDEFSIKTSSWYSLFGVEASSGKTYIAGNLGIGTTNPSAQLTVNGTIRNLNGPSPTSGTSLVITASGDIAPQSSDARYKTNVEDLPSVLDAVMNIRPVSYNWKDEPQKWYGLLAQQVSEVIPDAAWHNVEDDTYGVHYTPSIVTLLLKALQEMKQMYDLRISALEAQLGQQ